MNKFIKRVLALSKSIWFWLGLNTLLFTLAAFFLPIRFEVADDPIMCMLASGAYSGTPDYHLVFINAIYGMLLQGLYLLTDALEWYTILFGVWHILSMSIIMLYVSTTTVANRWVKLIFGILFYVLWMRILLLFQFTTTAGLLAFASLLLIYDRKYIITGICFFLVASLIRFDAAMLVGLMLSLLFIFEYNFQWKKYVPLIIVVISSFGLEYANSFFYRGEWATFYEYNTVRGSLNDNPNAVKITQLPAGISQTDYDLLFAFFPDPTILQTKQLQEIRQQVQKTSFSNKIAHIKTALRSYTLLLGLLVICSIGTITILFYKKKGSSALDKYLWLFCLIYLLWMLFIIGVVSANSVFKYRVFICMLFPTLFVLLYCQKALKTNWIIYSLLVLWSVIWISRTDRIQGQTKRFNAEWIEQQVFLEKYGKCNITGMPCVIGMNPFSISQSVLNQQCAFLGCYGMMPTTRITTHLDLINNSYLIFNHKDWAMDTGKMIQAGIKDHYNLDTNIEIVAKTSSYTIYMIKNK